MVTALLWGWLVCDNMTHDQFFCVYVDDFGIKYFNKEDAKHLLTSLKKHYKVTTDWEGRNYCGLTLEWQYDLGYIDVSMPRYVHNSLRQLGHVPTKIPEHSPHVHQPIYFGKKEQDNMQLHRSKHPH